MKRLQVVRHPDVGNHMDVPLEWGFPRLLKWRQDVFPPAEATEALARRLMTGCSCCRVANALAVLIKIQ